MTTLNPRDWPRLPDWRDPYAGHRSPQAINRAALERCCMVAAFCLCFAVLAPSDLMPLVFAGLLFLAGIASIGFALMRGDRPLAGHPTAWDEAAFLLTASLGLRLWLGPFPVN